MIKTYSWIALWIALMTAGLAASKKPAVISLKDFTSVKEWVLEITWHAKDTFEDSDFSAKLDMSASARFYLKRLDHQDAWGRWEVQKLQTSNLVYKANLIDKRRGQGLNYQGLSTPPLMSVANFQVGGENPGLPIGLPSDVPGSGKRPPPGQYGLSPDAHDHPNGA